MPAYFESGILRTPAWHGLGIVREGDGWFTLDDILTALPDTLGSPVEMLPLMAIRQSDDGYEALHVGNRFATVRQADGKVLGVVSDRYRLVQNPEALAFGEALIDKIGGGVWETAGTLMDGSWAWGLIRMPEDMLIGGLPDEAMERRLLITNTFDGSSSVRVKATTTRVVCSNTWAAALAGAGSIYTVRHMGNLAGQMAEAERALGIAYKHDELLASLGSELLSHKVTERFVAEWAETILPMPTGPEVGERARQNQLDRRTGLLLTWKEAENLENVRDTAWGAMQAAVEWDEHHRYGSREPDARMRSIFDDRDWQTLALDVLTEKLGVGAAA